MVTIGPAHADDCPPIADLLDELDAHYGATEPEPRAQRLAEIRAALFDQPTGVQTLLAHDGDHLVGMAGFSFLWPAAGASRSIFIKELYVRETHRSQGVAGN